MLLRLQRLSLCAAGLSICVFFSSISWMLWQQPNLLRHVDGTLTRTEAVLSKFYAVASNVDKTTKVIADSSKAQADGVADTMLQARGTLSAASDTLKGLQTTSAKLNESADAATGLLRAGTGTVTQATQDLRTLDASISATRPLIMDADVAVQNFDNLLASPDLADALRNVSTVTQNASVISSDFRQVSNKATADYLKPTKWYMQPIKRFGEIWDIGAAVARHTP
jgi:hypothetical protein